MDQVEKGKGSQETSGNGQEGRMKRIKEGVGGIGRFDSHVEKESDLNIRKKKRGQP